ncbi:E3 ubiquitin-protein ligase RGLG5-like [Dendronephthya gigantea]|uniref:E3 ubiquitin-protein ligase RGLG5-like n=1 Tax=Dendronephthya gigantea TaxID=151771 RepID=UPI00106C93F7|nr:E3 ubiquitin-protein ligase RGLG5-like [Dendronephthya gigantea]
MAEISSVFFILLEFVVISIVFVWFAYIIYNILYYPRKAYNILPTRIRNWSLLRKLGVTNRSNTFAEIEDRFSSIAEITKAMRASGLKKANLIIGIDFTASNEWQGRKTFGGRSLHNISIDPKSQRINKWNPYQRVIRAIGEGLQDLDEDHLIPVFGFGDERTKDHSVFSLMDESPCKGVEDVLARYTRTVGSVALSGPTSFAPIIRKSIQIVQQTGKYHVLLIIADGRVENEQDFDTRAAIVEASNYPLSIVLVGVGDGPWEVMHEYDDKLPQRRFDNFQFVEFLEKKSSRFSRDAEEDFAVQALMEIPDQYRAIRSLGLLGKNGSVDLNKNAGTGVVRRKKIKESRQVNHVIRRKSVEGVLETDL